MLPLQQCTRPGRNSESPLLKFCVRWALCSSALGVTESAGTDFPSLRGWAQPRPSSPLSTGTCWAPPPVSYLCWIGGNPHSRPGGNPRGAGREEPHALVGTPGPSHPVASESEAAARRGTGWPPHWLRDTSNFSPGCACPEPGWLARGHSTAFWFSVCEWCNAQSLQSSLGFQALCFFPLF